MIIATAGHVDHGKTSLVRALTGVDTDRLEEEKRRGLTIDIGFAYADLGGSTLTGFVDVPGHERFVRNMLAGVQAIDLALLVIAADDGPMPQTREHLAILDLLGAQALTVVLTKIDRADSAQRDAARLAIDALLADTRFAGATVFEVDTPAGRGLDALRAHLVHAQASHAERIVQGQFRLAIDRAFSVEGAGLVVTGAALSGQVRVGDTLVVSPLGRTVRVRGIHAQNRRTEQAQAGQRCALNLVGPDLHREEIGRGQWAVAPAVHAPTQRLDVALTLLAHVPRALEAGTRVQVHLGAGSVNARVAPISLRSLGAGEQGCVQLVLEHPVCAVRGDRFIVRDPTAQLTLGGGQVIDPFGPIRGRNRPERLAALDALALPDATQALRCLLDYSRLGVELDSFERLWNLDEAQREALHAATPMHRIGHSAGRQAAAASAGIALSPAHWAAWQQALLDTLADAHVEHPERIGLGTPALIRSGTVRAGAEAGELRRRADSLAQAALRTLADAGRIVRDGVHLRLPEHKPVLPAAQQQLLERLTVLLLEAGRRAPIAGELADRLGTTRADLMAFMREMAALGRLVAVAPNRYYLPATMADLARVARTLAEASPDGAFDAAAYRDASGIGRNITIEVLECLDRTGVTRFAGNRRRLLD
jgi:selenocysteine-specific elongation factor